MVLCRLDRPCKEVSEGKISLFCVSPLLLLSENFLSDIRQKKVQLPIRETAKVKRMLSNNFPSWGIVHYYYWCFGLEGIWQRINDVPRAKVRLSTGGTENRRGFDRVVAHVCMTTIGAVAARQLLWFAKKVVNGRVGGSMKRNCKTQNTGPGFRLPRLPSCSPTDRPTLL